MIRIKHLCFRKTFFVSFVTAVLVVMAVLLPLKNKAQRIQSLILETPVTLDGFPNEWPQPFRYYDGSTKLQFAIANDTANIYVCLKITDEPTQKRLFTAGLGIWIDAKGKKKETAGVMFPQKGERNPGEAGENRHSQMQEVDPAMQRGETMRLKRRAYMEQTTLRIKGFTGTPDQVLPLKNNYGIDAAFAWDSLDILSIEYKIPIALVLGHSLSAGDTAKPIGIGFVEPPEEGSKGANKEGDESGMAKGGDVSNSGSMNGTNRGGMGGMGGGGMGGGRGGGGGSHGSGMQMADANPLFTEQKVWSKVVLSIK